MWPPTRSPMSSFRKRGWPCWPVSIVSRSAPRFAHGSPDPHQPGQDAGSAGQPVRSARLARHQDEGPVVAADRFFGPDARDPGHWCAPPRPWQQPEARLLSLETRARLREALQQLPARQRVVVTMRDVEGMDADEVCELLDLSPENQRVLLHRGRSHLRNTLERYVAAADN